MGVTRIAIGAREDNAMARPMHTSDPHLGTVDAPTVNTVAAFRHCARRHVGSVRAVTGLGQAEGEAVASLQRADDELRLLRLRAKVPQHKYDRKIADDRMLVLQVVEQPQPLGRKMLANHCHPKIRAVVAAEFRR